MIHNEFEHELSAVTGETLETIRHRGFQLVEPPELQPLVIDWDAIYPTEPCRRIQRSRRFKAG